MNDLPPGITECPLPAPFQAVNRNTSLRTRTCQFCPRPDCCLIYYLEHPLEPSMFVQSLEWVPCTAACVERSDFFLDERAHPVQEVFRREQEHREACARPWLSADACRPGACGNYRRLTFRTQGKGWVKVQLIPFKEKKKIIPL